MKYKFEFLFCIIFPLNLIVSCSNNKHQNSFSGSLQKMETLDNKKDTVGIVTKRNDKVGNDTLDNYDVYRFSNDTIIQDAYINYVTPNQIKFFVRTKNKINSHECTYFGMAMMANGGEGTAQGRDELNDDELYSVCEYFTKGHPFFTIDVEFQRGKRMTLYTKDNTTFCFIDCPLTSQGTLRRIRLSKRG